MNKSEIDKFDDLIAQATKTGGEHFSQDEAQSLSRFYGLVLKWNKRLHLTTIAEPGSFLARHILESEFLASHISPAVHQVYDMGSGLGVPGIPLAILSSGLKIHLVESNKSKAIFLEEIIAAIGITNTSVICRRIESLEPVGYDVCITLRAIERMERIVPEILKIGSQSAQILILGSQKTTEILHPPANVWDINHFRIPGSNLRLLIELTRST